MTVWCDHSALPPRPCEQSLACRVNQLFTITGRSHPSRHRVAFGPVDKRFTQGRLLRCGTQLSCRTSINPNINFSRCLPQTRSPIFNGTAQSGHDHGHEEVRHATPNEIEYCSSDVFISISNRARPRRGIRHSHLTRRLHVRLQDFNGAVSEVAPILCLAYRCPGDAPAIVASRGRPDPEDRQNHRHGPVVRQTV